MEILSKSPTWNLLCRKPRREEILCGDTPLRLRATPFVWRFDVENLRLEPLPCRGLHIAPRAGCPLGAGWASRNVSTFGLHRTSARGLREGLHARGSPLTSLGIADKIPTEGSPAHSGFHIFMRGPGAWSFCKEGRLGVGIHVGAST